MKRECLSDSMLYLKNSFPNQKDTFNLLHNFSILLKYLLIKEYTQQFFTVMKNLYGKLSLFTGIYTALLTKFVTQFIVVAYCRLIEVHVVSTRRKEKHEWMCLCCFHWNTLRLQTRHIKPPLPTIPFDIVMSGCKLLWDNLSGNSCIQNCLVPFDYQIYTQLMV